MTPSEESMTHKSVSGLLYRQWIMTDLLGRYDSRQGTGIFWIIAVNSSLKNLIWIEYLKQKTQWGHWVSNELNVRGSPPESVTKSLMCSRRQPFPSSQFHKIAASLESWWASVPRTVAISVCWLASVSVRAYIQNNRFSCLMNVTYKLCVFSCTKGRSLMHRAHWPGSKTITVLYVMATTTVLILFFLSNTIQWSLVEYL